MSHRIETAIALRTGETNQNWRKRINVLFEHRDVQVPNCSAGNRKL
jgi:hypothetical protein